MKVRYPKSLEKKVLIFNLSLSDLYIGSIGISVLNLVGVRPFVIMSVIAGYIFVSSVLKRMFPRDHFTYWLKGLVDQKWFLKFKYGKEKCKK